MSYYDSVFLLEGSEGEAWDEGSAPYGLCWTCESPLAAEDDCAVCAPRCSLEYVNPVRASFIVLDGVVTERELLL